MIYRTVATFISLLIFTGSAYSQTNTAAPAGGFQLTQDYIPYILLGALVVALAVIVALAVWVNLLLDYIKKDILKQKGIVPEEEKEDAISKFFKEVEQQLTDAVPVEREKEIEFAHEYDGIRELDNNLPPWWKYMFYLSIIFAVVYLFYYHAGEGALSAEEYKQEMAAAELAKEEYLKKAANLVDESSVVVLKDESALARGKKTYTSLCVPCHGALGEGGIGPNMADEYWIHGGDIKNIFKTVKYGVPTKGMISWQTQLSPAQMQEVSSYILTLQGTNPPNAKEPQGEKYAPEAATETAL